MVSNQAGVQGLERAAKHGIPTVVVDHTAFDSREAFEEKIQEHLEAARIEIVCLAGFMR